LKWWCCEVPAALREELRPSALVLRKSAAAEREVAPTIEEESESEDGDEA